MDKLQTLQTSVSNVQKDIDHHYLVRNRYSQYGDIKKWNNKARLVLEFDTFAYKTNGADQNLELKRQIANSAALVDGRMNAIVINTIDAMASQMNDGDPNIFHNTYILYGTDHCLLHLKNTRKIKELAEEDEKLKNAGLKTLPSEVKDEKEIQKLMQIRMLTQEGSWDPRVQDQIWNNIYSINREPTKPFAHYFIDTSLTVMTFTLAVLVTVVIVNKWFNEKKEKKE